MMNKKLYISALLLLGFTMHNSYSAKDEPITFKNIPLLSVINDLQKKGAKCVFTRDMSTKNRNNTVTCKVGGKVCTFNDARAFGRTAQEALDTVRTIDGKFFLHVGYLTDADSSIEIYVPISEERLCKKILDS